ncbi:DUF1987 domain-containing protein [Alphaproteobacteria bacterium]|nr:DUF1987 domain-containing protein [Alphaproteobacteria bacterium]
MDSYVIDATSRTPAIKLDPEAGTLLIAGESYPEDVRSFFNELTAQITNYLATGPASFDVDIKLTYFNSSSARALMELLDQLEDAASSVVVNVNWYCDPDDDITREFAEDIALEVKGVTLKILDLDAE